MNLDLFGGILFIYFLAIDFCVFPFYVFGYLREEKRRKETVNQVEMFLFESFCRRQSQSTTPLKRME
jgi:hypothetical protein